MRRLLTIRQQRRRTLGTLLLTAGLLLGRADAGATDDPTAASAPLPSTQDGWPDLSEFLDEKYGFLPVVIPITEPAVGYGAAGGVAFLSKPLAEAADGFGRPNITAVGGLGTENGSWGAVAGDVRHWLDDRIQTLVGLAWASINLDFYGLGADPVLGDHPLRYNLEPRGGLFQGKYRIGHSRAWAGLGYALAITDVTFSAPAGTPGLPAYRSQEQLGALTPLLSYDSRDNFFTPTRGWYLEANAGLFDPALGSDETFQRVRLIAMQFVPVHPRWTLAWRADAAASFGDEPFYLRPYLSLRGAAAMRYQGEEIAQLEGEVRWQFWRRLSLVGFVGGGAAWNHLDHFDNDQSILTGGTGVRYEMARKYGLHLGFDIAFGPDSPVFYIQVGSAWARP